MHAIPSNIGTAEQAFRRRANQTTRRTDMSMSIQLNSGAQGAQGVQGGAGAGGGGKAEELQGKFDALKDKPDGAEKTQGLKDLKKDVDDAMKNEEKKEGGGDQKKLDQLMKLLEMIMQMLQQAGGGGEGGGGKGGAAAEGAESGG
ncbi:MAG TPA: hypothetical protein VFL86_02635 [Burkholderiaceae bacterium]|nr:hypothetical protein [Burkholderiaceae bacterium]